MAISILNLQDQLLIPLASLLFPLHHRVRFTPSFNNFFTLKTMSSLLLRSSQILACCCPAQSSKRQLAVKPSLRGQVACLSPPPHLHHGLDCHLVDFPRVSHLAPHSPPMVVARRGLQRAVNDDRPTLCMSYVREYVEDVILAKSKMIASQGPTDREKEGGFRGRSIRLFVGERLNKKSTKST